jgi:hypothetical protein
MLVILDRWDVEIRRTVVRSLPEQKIHKTPSQPIAGCCDGMSLSSQLCGKCKIRRFQSRLAEAKKGDTI